MKRINTAYRNIKKRRKARITLITVPVLISAFVLSACKTSEYIDPATASPVITTVPAPQATPVIAAAEICINSGYNLKYMIKADDSLWAWGSNTYGQLGTGNTERVDEPVKILEEVLTVETQDDSTFAILKNGTLMAWGDNSDGQLGDGTKEDRLAPVKILDGVTKVVPAYSRTFAVSEDGSIWGWGSNSQSALGIGENSDLLTSKDVFGGESTVPVKIMDDVVTAAAGNDFTLAVTQDGTLWGWGSSTGTGTDDDSELPVKVMEDVKSVYAGYYCAFALKNDGSLWSWGTNFSGQLGVGGDESINPIKVLDSVRELFVNAEGIHYNVYALKEDASLWAWGNNDYGQLGEGTTISRTEPVKVMEGIKTVAVSGVHTLAVGLDNSLWAWGCNSSGQIGDKSYADRSSPVKIMDGVKSAFSDFRFSYAIKEDGSLWVWGGVTSSWSIYVWSDYHAMPFLEFHDSGSWEPVQMIPPSGNAVVSSAEDVIPAGKPVPTPKQELPPIADVYTVENTSFFIRSDGSLWGSGSNSYMLLCDDTIFASAEQVKLMDEVKAVAGGSFHALALRTDGSVYSWGDNSGCQLGNGTYDDSHEPIKVMEGVAAIAAGKEQSLALKKDGSLWMWGTNHCGRGGSIRCMSKPEKMMEDVKAMAAGDAYILAVKNDGSLWEWGVNSFSDYSFFSADPVKILDGVLSVTAGYYCSFALKEDGSLWAWGWNYCGQLGDGTETNREQPVKIMDGVRDAIAGYAIKKDGSLWKWGGNLPPSMTHTTLPVKMMDNVKNVTAGNGYTIVLKEDGSIWAWGNNGDGQFGDGTTYSCWEPTMIG